MSLFKTVLVAALGCLVCSSAQPLQPLVAVNEQGYLPQDFQGHHDPMAGLPEANYPPQHAVWSCKDRPVNCLSGAAIDQLINRQKSAGTLQPIRIKTGGQPPEIAWLSKLTGTGRGTAQYHIPTNSLAKQELSAHPEFSGVFSPAPPKKLNEHQLVWRAFHRFPDGSPRKLYRGVELSHQAEAYHSPAIIPGFQKGWKVEKSTLESAEMNELRKLDNQFALMWRKPDGSLIQPHEVHETGLGPYYSGPTMCIHSHFADPAPCFAPYPHQHQGPTFQTPARLGRETGVKSLLKSLSPKKKGRLSAKEGGAGPGAKRALGVAFTTVPIGLFGSNATLVVAVSGT